MRSVWGMGYKVLSRHELVVSVFPPCKTVQQGHRVQFITHVPCLQRNALALAGACLHTCWTGGKVEAGDHMHSALV